MLLYSLLKAFPWCDAHKGFTRVMLLEMLEITAYRSEPQYLLGFLNSPQLIKLFSFIFYTDGYSWTLSPVLARCLQCTG